MAVEMRAFNASTLGADHMVVGMWDAVKTQIAPYIWQWFDTHKDQKVTTIAGIYTIRIGSFGIAEAILSKLFAPRA
jgi:hypothetical protein